MTERARLLLEKEHFRNQDQYTQRPRGGKEVGAFKEEGKGDRVQEPRQRGGRAEAGGVRRFAPKMQTEAILETKSPRRLCWRPGTLRSTSLLGSSRPRSLLQSDVLLTRVLIIDSELAGDREVL